MLTLHELIIKIHEMKRNISQDVELYADPSLSRQVCKGKLETLNELTTYIKELI